MRVWTASRAVRTAQAITRRSGSRCGRIDRRHDAIVWTSRKDAAGVSQLSLPTQYERGRSSGEIVTKIGKSRIAGMLLVLPAVVALCAVGASAAEVCRYTGSTDYDGRVAVTTDVTESNGITRIDVAGDFEATTMFWYRIHYLLEEVSTWRGGELQSVSMNSRYLLGDHVVRQSWDDFRRGGDGLQAYRVQGKTLADFRLKHPGFARHWDPATFGQPWLRDYPSAPPERRADLDLTRAPAGLRSPLALAFYWIRWLPRGEQTVPVFLPGFKQERLVELPIAGVPSSG